MTLENSILEKAIEALVKKARKEKWLEALFSALKKKHHILMLGATGTGKSQILEALKRDVPRVISRMDRTVLPEEHRIGIKKQPFVFHDTPGEEVEGHKKLRGDEIREAIRRNYSGVVNVVSYGYHEYRLAQSDVFTAKGAVRRGFLEKHREYEIAQLAEWTYLLGDPQSRAFFLTVVNKADLWWDERQSVMKHYSEGPYYKALGEAKSLRPATVEHCAVISKFYDIGRTSGLIGDKERAEMRARLIRTLLVAVGRYGNVGS